MAMDQEPGEQHSASEIDRSTGTKERVDKQKRAAELAGNPEDWREQK